MESGTFTDFISQLRTQGPILGIFVLLVILVIVTFTIIIAIRVRRIAQNFRGNREGGGGNAAPSNPGGGAADMPDLNMLLGNAQPAAQSTTAEPAFLRQPSIVNIQMSDGRMVEAAEMLIISRERLSDNLVVQIGEYAYDGTEGGVSPEFKRRFVKLMREVSEMAPALSKANAAASAPAAAPAAPSVPQPMPAASPEPSAPPTEQAEELDLAGQIESYLQQKLLTAPDIASRGLHVHSAPGGGVQIEVDGRYYASVDDVDDAEIKAYLQQTIVEWQSTK